MTSSHFTSAWGVGVQAALEAELEAALAHRLALQVTIHLNNQHARFSLTPLLACCGGAWIGHEMIGAGRGVLHDNKVGRLVDCWYDNGVECDSICLHKACVKKAICKQYCTHSCIAW